MTKESQQSQVLRWLESGKTLTPLVALNRFSIFRLGARIYDLRGAGYPIKSRTIKTTTGKHIAEYYFA